MSTKQETTDQFNGTGMNAYNAMIPNAAHVMNNAMQDPWHSSAFNANLALANKNAQAAGNRMNANALNNYSGNNVSGFLASQLAKNQRAVSGIQGNSYTNLLNSALQNRMGAASGAMAFKPLQTGQTQTTSGAGTWAPQLAGAAISAGMGIATGGMSTAAQAAGGGAANFLPMGGSGSANMTAPANPFQMAAFPNLGGV